MLGNLVSDEARSWIGRSAPSWTVEIHRSDIVKYSIATEQRLDKYRKGDEAPPMFLYGALRVLAPIDELGPDGLAMDAFLPDLPLKRVMAGGTKSHYLCAVKPGDVLVATRTLSGITEKQGATGPLIFIQYELTVTTDSGKPVMTETLTRIVR
jgi:3-methylfumaryl-CoA hydratase